MVHQTLNSIVEPSMISRAQDRSRTTNKGHIQTVRLIDHDMSSHTSLRQETTIQASTSHLHSESIYSRSFRRIGLSSRGPQTRAWDGIHEEQAALASNFYLIEKTFRNQHVALMHGIHISSRKVVLSVLSALGVRTAHHDTYKIPYWGD